MERNKKIHTLVECAILVAMSVVLSLVPIWQMPLGGKVTLVSMLPVCMIPVRHGMKWGLGSSFVYSIFQLILGITTEGILGWGLTATMLVGCIVFDYVVAFTVLGFAGIFRKNGKSGIYSGIALACILRFMSHFLSGYIIFRNLGQWELFGEVFSDRPVMYSLCYNGLFMLPELIITLMVTAIFMHIPFAKNKIFTPEK